MGTRKDRGVELCFVASKNIPIEDARGGGQSADIAVRRLCSEELAELISEVSGGDRARRFFRRDLESATLRVSVCSGVEEIRADEEGRTAYVELVRAEITRELSEVLAAEQVYRALMILNNRTYHK